MLVPILSGRESAECFASWITALAHGILQSSVLSLMLFNIYMKPLRYIVWGFELQCQYVNDTQFHLSRSSDPSESVNVLNVLEGCDDMWTS